MLTLVGGGADLLQADGEGLVGGRFCKMFADTGVCVCVIYVYIYLCVYFYMFVCIFVCGEKMRGRGRNHG